MPSKCCTFSTSELVKSVLPRCSDCLNLKLVTRTLPCIWIEFGSTVPELLSQFVCVTRVDVKHAGEGERVAAVGVFPTKYLYGRGRI